MEPRRAQRMDSMAKRSAKSKKNAAASPSTAAAAHEAARVLRRGGGDADEVRRLLELAAELERAESSR